MRFSSSKPIRWSSAAVFSTSKLGEYRKYDFKWCTDRVPDPPTLSDARTVPSHIIWQRFHYQSEGEQWSDWRGCPGHWAV